ncbi:hypothetical protein GO003_019515 [Methylicorpusculum oleiharenae]|uniref:hypothetical protein n=1 Tax=Methylicorpusculum oleiharenae TaxID=1338687 RepID=UPI0013585A6F|nr:hypothetical protein [Methylicorpusculum oleiharenae]MCD2452576.1 hypothetical protein [Methylicorpusculum oleiharenae]
MSDKEFNTENQNGGVDKKRRSLTKIGLTTPVIASLLSRPAFATQCSGSALASGNLSNQVELSTCGTCTSIQWSAATPAELASINISLTSSIGTIFTIPTLTRPTNPTNYSGLPILSGTIGQALAGTIVVHDQLRFKNNTSDLSGTEPHRTQLKAAIRLFTTAYLNALHIATKVNITYTPNQVQTAVNSALLITTPSQQNQPNRINIVAVNSLATNYPENGTSCAINRT